MIAEVNIEKVKRYFRTKNIDMKKVAEEMGLSASAISRKMNGSRPFTKDDWEKMIKLYPSLRYYAKTKE
jgi:transcriptional regulator with XRE-family HTH domain